MGEVYFYKTTGPDVSDLVRALLMRSRAAGWRSAVRARSDDALENLDSELWLRPAHGFFPHAVEGGGFDAEQPVLLMRSAAAPANRAHALILFDGADLDKSDVADWQRVSIVFRGDNRDELAIARNLWDGFAKAGVAVRYFSNEAGGWEETASKNIS